MRRFLFLSFLFAGGIAYADSKLTALTKDTTAQATDLFYKVDDPAGTPVSRSISLSNVLGAGATYYVGSTAQYVSSVTANSPLSASTSGTSGSTVTISISNNLPGGSTSYINATAQYVASVTANSPLTASTVGTVGSTVTLSMTNNLPGGSTSYVGSTALYVSSITTNASLNETFTGVSGATVTLSVNVSSISLPNSGVTAGSYTSANITVDSHGLVSVAANGTGGGVSVYPATATIVATTAGISASTVTVSSLTVTAQTNGIFSLVFDAAQAKLPGSASPYISNSTGEFSASVYFDDTSTQSATWTGWVQNYDGRALYADLVFTTTNTANFVCWNVYTATNTPNTSTNNYDSSAFNTAVSTAIRVNSNQLALSKATIQLTNTTTTNGDFLTVKVDRQTGGCGNTNSVGFGRLKKVRIYE